MSIQESGIFLLLTKNRWRWHWLQALMLCSKGNEVGRPKIALSRWVKDWILPFRQFTSYLYLLNFDSGLFEKNLGKLWSECARKKELTLHKCDISLLSPLEHSILYDLCPSFCSFPLHFCCSPHSSGLEWQCKQNIYIFFSKAAGFKAWWIKVNSINLFRSSF